MGRLIVLIILIAAAVLIWKAFGPSSWQSRQRPEQQPPQIKGPDDDPEFLWKLEKEQFKRRKEQQRKQEEQGKHSEEEFRDDPENPDEDTPPKPLN